MKNFFICIFFVLVIPPFLNYTALLREEKEFKQEGMKKMNIAVIFITFQANCKLKCRITKKASKIVII